MPRTQATMRLDIVSAEGQLYAGDVHQVCIMGAKGELGILPRHSALLTTIRPGVVRFIPVGTDEENYLYVSGGMLEVQPHGVIVLADLAMRCEDIDEQAAREAKRRALDMMQNSVLYTDRDEAQAVLLQAMAQLAVVDNTRKNRKARKRA
ncbi:F-type H+-transporting ATPase subunit epsilon [Ectothiorhodospira magna]|uniref:ATP synthase epsilon chain n=2 Tax=Ectothiorhodospira magna TaxID=867345 RepID=A0A1H9BD36_9GAMM|nr:F0F1 ATP synthase subunit epsilon [Ectothiorhodospira magna]SEP86906.1 F-type H+-transporting ATPase subunit epsilon [Ectothiorhodospira magna]